MSSSKETFATQANFYAETFKQLELSGEAIASKEFDGCTFSECNFSESTFKSCKFIECHFSNCDMSLVKWDYSRFVDCIFEGCKLVGVDWAKASWPTVSGLPSVGFKTCVLNDASFYGLDLQHLVMEDCKVHDCDFRSTNLSHAVFCYSDLTSSLFVNTNLAKADFSEATNYDIDLNTNNIKGAKFTRFEAVRLLERLGIELVD